MDFTKKAVMENREYGIENGEWQTLFNFKMEDKSYIFVSVFLIHNTFAIKKFKVNSDNQRKNIQRSV